MAPNTIQSWVDSLQQGNLPPTLLEEGTSVGSDYDEAEKDWENSKAQAVLEGKYYPFEESAATEKTDEQEPIVQETKELWKSLAPAEAPRDLTRISNLSEAGWEPDLTPERLRPTRSQLSQLTRDLESVGPAPKRRERSDSTKLTALHEDYWLCRDVVNRSHRSGSLEHSRSSVDTGKQARSVSMPDIASTPDGFRVLSLQPSDVPYPISWLISAYSGESRHSQRHSAPPISRLYSGPHDDTPDHLGLSETHVEYVRQPSQIKMTIDDSAAPASPHRDTISPEDSISICSPKQSMDTPAPDLRPPVMSHRITHVPTDSISYCPSQSTHAYIYQRPDAVVTMKRVATPPLVTAFRGVQEMEEPTSPGARQTALYPPFRSPPPVYDPNMGPIRSIPLEKLPPGYQPEPRNGRIAWLHAVTGLLIVFNCWGINNAYGLFQEYYQTSLPDTSPSTIAWIGSTQLAMVFVLGFPVGKLVDLGYFRLVFHSGTIVMLLGIFCTAWCVKLWQLFLVQGLVTGLGMGMVFCSGVVALMTWFDETHVGMAMGIVAAGSAIGGISYVLIARYLLKLLGFATTMRILGGVATAAMIPPTLVYRMRDQKHKDLRRCQRSNSRIRVGSFSSNALMPPPVTINAPIKPGWRSFFEPAYILAGAGMFFAFLGVYFGFVFMVSYGSFVLGLSQKASTNLLIYMLAANLAGRFLPALISDRCIGPLNTIIPSVLLTGAVTGLWAASEQTEVSLIVIACFYGFVSAGVQVLYAPTVQAFCMEPKPTRAPSRASTFDTYNDNNQRLATDRLGMRAGGIFTFIGIACLIGPPIGGALINYRADRGLSQPFLGAQIFASVSLFLSGALLLASRVAKAGWTARRA